MSKLEQVSVEFSENPYGIFNAGAHVGGKIVVQLSEGMKAGNIRLRFNGEARTRWSEPHWNLEQLERVTVTYDAHKQYLSHDLVLWGNPSGTSNESPIIQPGRHEFNFTFALPGNCPTSFEGTYGSIRYYIEGIIEKPRKLDHTMKRPITVIGLQDLNMDPSAMMPIQISNKKNLGFWCCKAGNISLTIDIPRQGYVGGEYIPFHLVIQNDSSREIKKIRLRLLQCAQFRAKYSSRWHSKHSEKTVLEWADESIIPAGEGVNRNDILMQIPSLPPMLFGSGIINLWYYVDAKVTPSGPSMSLEGKLPVTIGSVPLRQLFVPQPQQPMPQMPDMPQTSATRQPQPSEYDRPPPTYEESFFGRKDIREEGDDEHTRGELDWAPRYPVFGNGK